MPRSFAVAFLTWFALTASAHAQTRAVSFGARLDRDTITVGDRLRLRLEVTHAATDSVQLLPDVRLPSTLKVLETLPARRETVGDGNVRVSQTFVLTSYRTGSFEIPAASVRLARANGDTTVATSDAMRVFVRSVKPDDVTDIQDVKRPVSVDARIPVWAWVVLGLLLVGIVLLVVYLRKRRRRPHVEPPPPPVDWFAEVRGLAASGLLEKGEFALYYTQLSEAFRRFLEVRTGIEAMERTTEEIGRDLAGLHANDRSTEVRGFLSEADLVKFARHAPGVEKGKRDLQHALELMQRIDDDAKAAEAAARREVEAAKASERAPKPSEEAPA